MSAEPKQWGFGLAGDGSLAIGNLSTVLLANEFGTPLHVMDESGLRSRARAFRRAFEAGYPAPVRVHYALKCNSTPGVLRMILEEGLHPEVGTAFEWSLARRLGASPEAIIVNGPNKGPLLRDAIAEGAGLIVLDGTQDLEETRTAAQRMGSRARVLIRVNPDRVPRGMNRASATGSRRHSVFGFDWARGECDEAIRRIAASPALVLAGFHCHVGTGIQRTADYDAPARILVGCLAAARRAGLEPDLLDLGGGFGVATSRELDTIEFLLYQSVGRLPRAPEPARFPAPRAFAQGIRRAILAACRREDIPPPRLVLEPGRAIVSGADALLVRVGAIKERPGAGAWAITDGGAGTVAFPLYYEVHEILRCRVPGAPRTRRYTLVGPACFSADWLGRNRRMPPLRPGDVLAICDAGAYFTSLESNFGFPRPPVVAVRDGVARLLRRRETYEDMVARDVSLLDEPDAADAPRAEAV
jgi:diaminopimelate decarboxylase